MSEINLRAKFDVSDVRKGAEEYIKSIKNVETSTETASHETQKSLKGLRETVRKQMDDVKNSITESSLDIRAQINVIKNLQTEINKLRSARDKAAPGESKSSLNIQINSAKAELEGERAALVQLQSKQESAKRTLNDLKNKYREYSEQLKSSAKTTSKYSEAFKLLPQPIQNAVNATKALTKAAAAFIATPLGLILGALVLSYKAVTLWANNSAEGQIAFARSSAYLDGILKKLQNTAMSVGKSIYMAFSDPKQAAKDFGQSLLDNVTGRFKAVGKGWQSIMKIFSGEFKEGINGTLDSFVEMTTGVSDLSKKVSGYVTESEKMALANQKIKESEIALAKSRREASITLVDYESKIAEARRKATDRTLDNKERLQANEEAKQMIQERFDLERDLAEEELRIQKEKINLKGRDNASIEELNEEAALTVKLKKLDKERFNALRELNETSGTVRREIISAQKASAQATVDLELKAQRERLAILQESKNKSIALIELETKERLAAIAKEEKALIEQNKKAGINGLTKKQSEEFTVRRQVVSDDETRKRTELEKKYKEETQKQYEELTDIFLTEEERKTAAVERRYRELRKANEEQYKNELAAIEATQTGPEKEQAQKEATAQYEETKVLIDKAEVQENLNEVLEKYKSFSQQRLEIEEQYNRDIKVLQDQLSKATTDEQKKRIEESIKVAKENQGKALSDLSLSMLEETDLWTRLFSDTSKHTSKYIQNVINETQQLIDYMNNVKGVEIPIGFNKEQIDDLKKDPEKIKAILEQLEKQRDTLNKRNPFSNLIKGFKDLVAAGDDSEKKFAATQNIIENLEGVAAVVNTVSDALGSLGFDEMNEFAELLDKTASFAQSGFSIGGGWGALIGGVIGLTSGIASLNSQQQKYAEINAENARRQAGYWESINYQVSKYTEMLKELGGEEYFSTLENTLNKIDSAIKNTKESILNFPVGEVDKITYALSVLHATGGNEKFLQFIIPEGEKQSVLELYDIIKDLDTESLISLKENEKYWSMLPDWMQEAIDKLIEYTDQRKELQAELSKDLLQTTPTDIENIIVEGLKNGKKSVKEFGEDFENTMRDALLQSFAVEQLRPKIKQFYEKYAELAKSENGKLDLTSSEIEELRNDWNNLIQWSQEQFEGIKQVAGINDQTAELERQTGTISETITEQTAQESMGIWRGSYDTLKAIDQKVLTFHESYKATMTTCSDLLSNIARNTGNTANNTYVLLEVNDTLNRMDSRLRTLESNSNKKFI
ncbi:MAG: hypothetical protein EGP82_00260 [Odoribacter splanchnicus]|nr:hypothetical protein [Odoribacter splanchnicus]